MFPKPYADLVARFRVPAGFLLVAAFAWFAAPTPGSIAAGLPIAMLGLWLRGWAAGHLAKNEKLATSGPYAHLRNPLYLGTLIVAAGLAVASWRLLLAVLFAAVFALVYLPAIQLEQQHLRDLFPEYADYTARVPLMWPRLARAGARDRFRWQLYVRNEEYKALLGFLAAALLLAWKTWR
jgi:protein-S-isoprenylcysteine O-methyltransferase Ste14